MMRITFVLLLAFSLFTVKLTAQCTVVITNPPAVCSPATVNLTAPAVTAGSTAGLSYSYYTDASATIVYPTPAAATAGTYYIKGDNGAGCTQVQPVIATVTTPPTANISYAGTPFCQSLGTAQPVTLTGTGSYAGGTFSSTAGLTINSSTGAITPGTSTAATYTVTYTIPAFGACPTSPVTTSVTIVGVPTAPVTGTITQPTCSTSTGSVALSGLPSFGDWIVSSTPDNITLPGNGLTTTFTNLRAGVTYTFKVTNYAGCVSPSSGPVIIQSQPTIPSAPLIGTITAPTCSVATGSVVLNGLPAAGWTLTRYSDGVIVSGSGASTTISNLNPGTYFFVVANLAGCTSPISSNVVIPAQPSSPAAPMTGTITQPTCALGTGSVALSGLPSSGTWTVTISPGGATMDGSGTTAVFSAILPGTYTFTVKGTNGCTSPSSSPALINAQPVTPSAPAIGTITQPTCAVATGSVVLNSLPAGNWILTRNPGAVTTAGSTTSLAVSGLDPGSYTFTVTNSVNCTSLASVPVAINAPPPSPGTPEFGPIDCSLGFGHAVITITTPLGAGIQYSLDGAAYQSSNVFQNVANGNHYLAARNASGCTTSTGIFAVSCGCISPPEIVLSAASDSTCGNTPVTVSGNTFSNATTITLTHNGAGTLNPSSIATPGPFAFTYTPASSDRGKVITITLTSNNPLGSPCSAAVVHFLLSVNAVPTAPAIGTITNPTCISNIGSVVLNGLPSSGVWTLTRNPDEVVTTGTGTSTTEAGLAPGTYTFSVVSEAGCASAVSNNAVINPPPGSPLAPVIDSVINPTCTINTGSIMLSGLPATGTWTLTRLPGGTTRTGTGTAYTATLVPSGTYTYTVANASGCVSPESKSIVIDVQPVAPPKPTVGTITAPTCKLATGSVELLGLPATGTWTLTRYPGLIQTKGTGVKTTITGLTPNTYNYTVTSAAGCESLPSNNIIIPAQPPTPTAPIIGKITQPTLAVPTGSVVLSGLPTPQAWVLTRHPSNVTTAGSGASYTVTGLAGGLYTFTVTNSSGCTSDTTKDVIISTPGKPILKITDPPAVCLPGKVDLTAPEVTAGSTTGLTYTYWTDIDTTQKYLTPEAADSGIYYIKGTTVSGFYDIKPVTAVTVARPVANAGPDQVLSYEFSTTMAAELGLGETGAWSVGSGKGIFIDIHDPLSVVNNLGPGQNVLLWAVTNDVCPADTDKVLIVVGKPIIPTLITPNGDSRNEYFIIGGLESLGKTELIIFDRRGALVFRNSNYDNKWNGVDYNDNPLPDDTYFYLIKVLNGPTLTGYIVIRR